ncbi:ABC transporter ATP-binding protein [Candidatus Fermentibacterales bacterium]|nr:ABC transporter ATP-binding protein [Candidatus Fermentibacterales bacterium]
MTGTSALDIRGLVFSYPEKPGAIDSIDLSIARGEKVGVIGPNGSGKTTLFLLAAGVLRPDHGNISIGGAPIVPGRFNPAIGMVFQDPDDQLFCPSVEEDIGFGPANTGLHPDRIGALVRDSMQRFGVAHLASRPPHHLSGGEKRLVTMAAVSAMSPEIILYDEPDASLDSRSRRSLIGFLSESGETLLVASHDLELVLEVCPRVVIVDQGRIVADGSSRELMSDERLMTSHGLEKPHSLAHHSPENGHSHSISAD